MIGEELRSRIRRLFFAEHWKVGTISAELGVHHDTVANAIEAPRFINIKYRAQASALEAWQESQSRSQTILSSTGVSLRLRAS